MDLSNLRPPKGAKHSKKRVGRGQGSGNGKTAGRGHKGAKSRSGFKHKRGFEGGQMPLYMRLGKQRGNTSKDAMPVGPFRTRTYHVNLRDLEARFEAGDEVTPETLAANGLIRNTRHDVKLLGEGDLTKKLTITVHRASASAREKIGAAGGKLTVLRDEDQPKKKRRAKPKAKETPEAAAAKTTAAAEEKVGDADTAVGDTPGDEKVPEGEG